MKRILFICFLLNGLLLNAQNDSVNNRRAWWISGGNAVLIGASSAGLNALWYKDYPKSSFHFFNDSKNWLYMDKCGHAYTAYQLSSVTYSAYRWAKLPSRKALIIGSSIAWTYQFSVELLDGFSSEWGFSIADVGANTVGCLAFSVQEWFWHEQLIQPKMGYFTSGYAPLRPEVLGSNFSERLLKDYNAQSYWLCSAPSQLFSNGARWNWLQLGIGYSVDQKLKGDASEMVINGIHYKAHPEFALSLDIDWRKLPIHRKWLKTLVRPLNAIKLPFPSVFWRNGVCYVGFF